MLTSKLLHKSKSIFIAFFMFSIFGALFAKFLNNAKQKGLVNKESLGLIIQSKKMAKEIEQKQLQAQPKEQSETPPMNTNLKENVAPKVEMDEALAVTATATNDPASESPQDLDALIKQVATSSETFEGVPPVSTTTPKIPTAEPLPPSQEESKVLTQEKLEQQIVQIALNAVDIINSRFVISYYPANTSSNPKIFYAIPTEVIEYRDTSLSDVEVQILYQMMSSPPNQERELIIDPKLKEMEKKIIEIGQDSTLSDVERNQKMLQLVQQNYAGSSHNIYRATVLKIIPNPISTLDTPKDVQTAKPSSNAERSSTTKKAVPKRKS